MTFSPTAGRSGIAVSSGRGRPGRVLQRTFVIGALILGTAAMLSAAAPSENWTRYFPDLATTPADAAGWATLAASFPNRVKPATPATATPTPTPAATKVEVRPGIDYVRVRQLANDLGVIEAALATPRLIIDLRYVHGEFESAKKLAALLARRAVSLEDGITIPASGSPRGRLQTTLCLVNRGTSGALEAVLDALQHAGDVLLVGTQTAGDTGTFTPANNAPGWRVIADDYRRAGGPVLLDVGVTPGLFVETTPNGEDAAYLAFDASKPISDLLDVPVEKPRFDEARLMQRFEETRPGNGRVRAPRSESEQSKTDDAHADDDETESSSPDVPAKDPAKPEATDPAANPETPPPFDRSLQRAVATLVADAILRDSATITP